MYLLGEGSKEAAEDLGGGGSEVTVITAQPLGGIDRGAQARGLGRSGQEAGGGGGAGEAASGGGGESVVAEVVPAEGPRTARGENGEVRRDSASTGCGGGVSPVGAGDGDAGEE
jgi:hypothetical protein